MRLDEYDKEEFRTLAQEVARRFGRPFDDEQFERDWAEFIEMKRKKALN